MIPKLYRGHACLEEVKRNQTNLGVRVSIEPNFVWWFFGVIIASLGAILLAPLRDWISRVIVRGFKWIWAAIWALPKFVRLRAFVLSSQPLWRFRRAGSHRLRSTPIVMTVMNFKGGVGKTTIAANLAASMASLKRKKVLVVDLDYQGSLSDLLRENVEEPKDENLLSDWLTQPVKRLGIEKATTSAKGLDNVRLVSAEYQVTETEDNQFLRWLIGETRDDVRNRISRVLRSAALKYGEQFDIVIMDAPPRLSLASANALRASHYVLVPTKLQPLSALPIAKMLDYLETFKTRIKARFEVIGVVCNMTSGLQPSGSETSVMGRIEEALENRENDPIILAQFIPDRVGIGRPRDSHLAYLSREQGSDDIRRMFDSLTEEICDRIGLED